MSVVVGGARPRATCRQQSPMERETSTHAPSQDGADDVTVAASPESGPQVVDAVAAPAPETKRARKAGSRGADKRADSGESEGSIDPALVSNLEALIISLDRPVQPVRLAQGLGLLPMPEEDDQAPVEGPVAKAAIRQVERAIATLNEQYSATQRAFRIEHLAGGYRVMTLAAYAPILATFHKRQTSSKLSRAAVETLAIIAYKQPLTKAELEAIRGVSCGEVLKTLLEKRLVTVKGRAEELGRPLLYGTTADFLKLFGLASIKDLPSPTELKLST